MNDLTRGYVAAELKMSTSGYGKIEREIDLTLSKLYKISAIFSISITDLLYFNVQIFLNDSKEVNLKSSGKEQTIFNKERIFDLEKENFFKKKKGTCK
jgi:transcriptional regulator with XRE-family HTH domain